MRSSCPIGYAMCRHCDQLYVTRRGARPTDATCRDSECRRLERNRQMREWLARYQAEHGQPYQRRYATARAEAARRWRDGKPSNRQRYPEASRAADQRRRARKSGADVERFRAEDVFQRDGWVCGICERPVDPKRSYPDPLSPSLDHVVPLSEGGAHTMANTRCSHLDCNLRRGARGGGEQLRMVG